MNVGDDMLTAYIFNMCMQGNEDIVSKIMCVTDNQMTAIYRMLMKNSEIFSNHLGKCISRTNKFKVANVMSFNLKSTQVSIALLEMADTTGAQC